MNNHETLDPLQQRIALLALAATQPTNDAGACPGDAQLTAFIEHRLTGAAREAMLYHLNRCPTCYQVWLDTVEVLQDEEPTPVQQPETHQEIHWWQRLLTLTTWRPQLVIPVTRWPCWPAFCCCGQGLQRLPNKSTRSIKPYAYNQALIWPFSWRSCPCLGGEPRWDSARDSIPRRSWPSAPDFGWEWSRWGTKTRTSRRLNSKAHLAVSVAG